MSVNVINGIYNSSLTLEQSVSGVIDLISECVRSLFKSKKTEPSNEKPFSFTDDWLRPLFKPLVHRVFGHFIHPKADDKQIKLEKVPKVSEPMSRVFVGKSQRAKLAVAANPRYEETPVISSLKDKVWVSLSQPYRSANWHNELRTRLDAATNLIKKTEGNDREIQRSTYFIKDYLKILSIFSYHYMSSEKFIKDIKPSLSHYV